MEHFGWPQWVMASITAVVFLAALISHNEDKHKFTIPIWMGITWVLWMGGFY